MENITRLPTSGVDIYVAEVIIFQSLRDSHFPLLSVGLPFPFHPSRICVGGIKVVLLSSKLQISFASVHLTLCFITVARGAKRFSSPLCKVITPTNYYSILCHYLLHDYYYSSLGWGDYFHGTDFIGLYSED